MGCKVWINQHGRLTLILHWRGKASWEGTGLLDTSANRKRVEAAAAKVNHEVSIGVFTPQRYLHYFPNGNRAVAMRRELGLLSEAKKTPTLRGYVENDWLPRQVEPIVRKAQARDVRAHWERYLADKLGDLEVGAIAQSDVEGWKVWMLQRAGLSGKGVSVKTTKNAHGTLMAILRDAIAIDKLATINAADGLRWPRRAKVRPDPLEVKERQAVLEYFRTKRPRYYQFIATLLYSGMRPGEACGLRWGDVDLTAGTIHIRRSRVLKQDAATKTERSDRTIRALPELLAILGDPSFRPLVPSHDDPVFVGPGGVPLYQDRVRERQWAPALAALGIKPRRLYECRHSFISWALTRGMNVKFLSEYVATSVANIERHYGRFLKSSEAAELAKLSGENVDIHGGSRVQAETARIRTRKRG